MKNISFTFLISTLLLLLVSSCKKEKPEEIPDPETGRASLRFHHYVDGQPLKTDSLIYINEAGNPYMVNEIQYFISDLRLLRSDGSSLLLDGETDIYYVDTDIPSTWLWSIFDRVPAGSYSGISFVFGISQPKNQSYMFVNPPERDMFWPEYLGGGYHYLKLNGKWQKPDLSISPFDFHIGIGQITDTAGNITGFVHNDFTVSIPHDIIISKDATTEIGLVMNVESWFKTPVVWDHNVWGSFIMQNQQAMSTAASNGHDAFTISYSQ